MIKPTITEAEAEKLADARVQRRLAADGEYRNAENAGQQADREAAIESSVWRAIEDRYQIV